MSGSLSVLVPACDSLPPALLAIVGDSKSSIVFFAVVDRRTTRPIAPRKPVVLVLTHASIYTVDEDGVVRRTIRCLDIEGPQILLGRSPKTHTVDTVGISVKGGQPDLVLHFLVDKASTAAASSGAQRLAQQINRTQDSSPENFCRLLKLLHDALEPETPLVIREVPSAQLVRDAKLKKGDASKNTALEASEAVQRLQSHIRTKSYLRQQEAAAQPVKQEEEPDPQDDDPTSSAAVDGGESLVAPPATQPQTPSELSSGDDDRQQPPTAATDVSGTVPPEEAVPIIDAPHDHAEPNEVNLTADYASGDAKLACTHPASSEATILDEGVQTEEEQQLDSRCDSDSYFRLQKELQILRRIVNDAPAVGATPLPSGTDDGVSKMDRSTRLYTMWLDL